MARTAGMSSAVKPRPSGIDQQLFRQRLDEHLGPLQERLAQARPTPLIRVPSASTSGGIERNTALVRRPPGADHVEVLEREPDRIHRPGGSRRRRGRRDAAPSAARIVCGASPGSVSASAGHVGRRRRRRRAEEVLEHPLAAQHRRGRRRVRRDHQHGALAEQAPPRLVGQRARGGSGCRRRRGCRSAWPAAR